MERSTKVRAIIMLGVLYILAVIILSIGFFTPAWVVNWNYEIYRYWNEVNTQKCSAFGIISRECNFDASLGNEVRTLVPVTWMMVAAMIIVYSHLIMLALAFAGTLYNNQIFMTFFSVLTGVFYPIAAILDLVATIMVEIRFGSNSGYSVMMCTIGGGIMTLFYGGLRLYDHKYTTDLGKRTADSVRSYKSAKST